MVPRARALAAAALFLAATGCHVTIEARVDVGADGTGVVRAGVGLDQEAIRQAGDLTGQVRADDLRQAGWDVTGPRQESDGLTWIRVSQRFSDPDEATELVAQLSGPEGLFRDFRISRSRSLLRTRTEFTGVLDASNGLTALSDPDLEARVGEGGLGLGIDALRQQFGPDLGRVVSVDVVVRLPGDVEANTPPGSPGRAHWRIAPGERLELRANGDAGNGVVLVVAGVTLGAVLAGLVLVGLRQRSGGRRWG